MANALAVWAEEGRLLASENNGESVSRRYQPLVSQWGNPSRGNTADPPPFMVGEGDLAN